MNKRLEIKYININDIKPYEKNPRNNKDAIPFVVESIKKFGFKNPIILDKNNVIICGHTRLEAAKKLKIDELPCLYADDLTEEQIKAFRLVDNKVAEKATWNDDLLEIELNDILNINMQDFGFDLLKDIEELVNPYSQKVNIPQYEITGDCPDISELVDDIKTKELIREIQESSVSEKEKEFLMNAAMRHLVFNYKLIAEYYAHADEEMQKLMEKSALVIIDLDDAIANGYAQMIEKLKEMVDDDE